ncbi:hypothetical protein L873DRAFT_1712758, partial [Choiromyces venosus 120613-1]
AARKSGVIPFLSLISGRAFGSLRSSVKIELSPQRTDSASGVLPRKSCWLVSVLLSSMSDDTSSSRPNKTAQCSPDIREPSRRKSRHGL